MSPGPGDQTPTLRGRILKASGRRPGGKNQKRLRSLLFRREVVNDARTTGDAAVAGGVGEGREEERCERQQAVAGRHGWRENQNPGYLKAVGPQSFGSFFPKTL